MRVLLFEWVSISQTPTEQSMSKNSSFLSPRLEAKKNKKHYHQYFISNCQVYTVRQNDLNDRTRVKSSINYDRKRGTR